MSLYDESLKYWHHLRLMDVVFESPYFDKFVSLVRKEYSNGFFRSEWFDLNENYTGNEFTPENLFNCLVETRLIRNDHLKNLFGYNIREDYSDKTIFEKVYPYNLPGLMGGLLLGGGAYSRQGDGALSFQIGLSAAMELCSGDLTKLTIWHSSNSWSDLHFDVAWDVTLIIKRKFDNKLIFIMGSDTD